jgi:predicted RNA binding protein YcfA (HicA-like mRNA interferase family)
MTKLPRGLSGKKVIKTLERAGFYVRRKKGSHVIMRRENPFAQVVIPDHRSVDTGTLDVIIEGAGLTIDEFMRMVK